MIYYIMSVSTRKNNCLLGNALTFYRYQRLTSSEQEGHDTRMLCKNLNAYHIQEKLKK